MKNRKRVFVGIFFALIALASFYFDSIIVQGFSLIRNGFLNSFFLGLTFLSSKVIIFFLLTILFLFFHKKRKWIIPVWFILALSFVMSFLLKVAVQRQRPFQQGLVSILPVLEKASHFIWNFSFPSASAMMIFSILPILNKEFPKLKYFWVIFASLVAFSRVYFGLHFFSDVLIGGLMGYLLGSLVIKVEKDNKFWEGIYKKTFRKE